MADDFCHIGTRVHGYDLAAPVLLSRDDRRRHVHLIGKTGTGKTTLMKALIFDDLSAGRDFALLDPLGGLATEIADAIPVGRNDTTIYWNPGADLDQVIAFNPLDRVPRDRRPLVADHVVDAFNHIWGGDLEKTPRLIYVLLYGLRVLLDAPDCTLLDLPRLLIDERYRYNLLEYCEDPLVRTYWLEEFASYGERFRVEAVAPVQNRVGVLLSAPALRNILAQPRSTIDLSRIMNERGSIIVNLAKGKLGRTGAHLLGALLATTLGQVAEERADITFEDRRDFTLYMDEVQNFATPFFAGLLSESRNWKLSLCLAHQYLSQVPVSVRDAIIGNCGSNIVFRVGATDANVLAPELNMANPAALSNAANFTPWARILERGEPSEAFVLSTRVPEPPAVARIDAVIAHTRARHCRPREAVEKAITLRLGAGKRW